MKFEFYRSNYSLHTECNFRSQRLAGDSNLILLAHILFQFVVCFWDVRLWLFKCVFMWVKVCEMRQWEKVKRRWEDKEAVGIARGWSELEKGRDACLSGPTNHVSAPTEIFHAHSIVGSGRWASTWRWSNKDIRGRVSRWVGRWGMAEEQGNRREAHSGVNKHISSEQEEPILAYCQPAIWLPTKSRQEGDMVLVGFQFLFIHSSTCSLFFSCADDFYYWYLFIFWDMNATWRYGNSNISFKNIC